MVMRSIKVKSKRKSYLKPLFRKKCKWTWDQAKGVLFFQGNAISKFPIMHLICPPPPKFCISIVFSVSWDGCSTHEKWKTKGMQIFFLGGGGQIRCIRVRVRVRRKSDGLDMKAIFYSRKLNSLSPKRSRTWPHIESELEFWNSEMAYKYASSHDIRR